MGLYFMAVKVNQDAPLSGMCACFENIVYALPMPHGFLNLHIIQLVALNVVVAIKFWAQVWANKKNKCNNLAMVEVLKFSKTRNQFLPTCARNVWLITAIFNIETIVIHYLVILMWSQTFLDGRLLLILNIDSTNCFQIFGGLILI